METSNELRMELACELAHARTFEQLKDTYTTESDLYVQTDCCINYKEDVQDVFNDWYDYYLDKINEVFLNQSKIDNRIVVKVINQPFQWERPKGTWDELGFNYQITE